MMNIEKYEDIIVTERAKALWITIDRPSVYNAFRAQTVEEMIHAFQMAAGNREISSVVLTGSGDKAFSAGGDQSVHSGESGIYDGRGVAGMPFDELQSVIRDIPKPVIARVNGYAIGGGNVLATLCDMTIAAESAQFGQVGPKVGSFDAGWGSALLARHVGDKRAREIWFLCKRYSAREALEMGLVNRVVPLAELDEAVDEWTELLAKRSPTAIAFLKRSFNADSESIRGISYLAVQGMKLFYQTDESREGVSAFLEKRDPDFSKFTD